MIRILYYILRLCCLLAANSGFFATISYDMKVSKGIVLNSTSTRGLKKKKKRGINICFSFHDLATQSCWGVVFVLI